MALQRLASPAQSALEGHGSQNLLIAAMMHITGDFEKADRPRGRILAVRGHPFSSRRSHEIGGAAVPEAGV